MNIIRCPEEALSADFGDIVIGNVASRLDFTVAINQDTVLLETYWPDNAGAVYIRDMDALAGIYRQAISLDEDMAPTNTTVTLSLALKEGTQTLNRTVKLYACDLETAGTLTPDILKRMPLSRCFNKTVAPGQREYISFYGTGTVTLLAVYTGTRNDLSKTLDFAALPENPDIISCFNVSPEVIAERAGIELARMVYYILYKDKKYRIKYTLKQFQRPGKTFAFLNAFGAVDSLTSYGNAEREQKWTREYGTINRKKELISREVADIYTVNTGYLSREQTEVTEDLLNARKIVLIDAYGRHPAVIEEEKMAVKYQADELIDVEFKYRLASNRIQYRFDPHKYRIFDYTHNKTFN
jgi:hypothetical protein